MTMFEVFGVCMRTEHTCNKLLVRCLTSAVHSTTSRCHMLQGCTVDLQAFKAFQSQRLATSSKYFKRMAALRQQPGGAWIASAVTVMTVTAARWHLVVGSHTSAVSAPTHVR